MKPIIEFDNVSYRYGEQGHPALNGFSVCIPAGEKIAVIGKNGSGKSTFFLHCNGLYWPDEGVIKFMGEPLKYDRKSIKALRQRVGLVFQNPDDQLFSASVEQDISFGPLNLDLPEDEVRVRVQEAARLCEIECLLQRPTHALSGGEKARAALAGILAMQPEVMVCDEMMASLDPWVRLGIFAILDRLHAQGKTIILATHDFPIVQTWATYVIFMEAGGVKFAGTPQGLLDDRTLLEDSGLAAFLAN
jgi:cobalt/nickel transport system ATP-binding protein